MVTNDITISKTKQFELLRTLVDHAFLKYGLDYDFVVEYYDRIPKQSISDFINLIKFLNKVEETKSEFSV